jgi:hypothetical protein
VEEKGIYVPDQHYGLSSFTGNNNDSLIFPLQGSIFSSGRRLMQFPATYQSGWTSKSRRSVDFKLSVTAAGLNKTPGKHVFTVFRKDTIVGWGKMRVYTAAGPSEYYNVLVDKVNQYSIDSFFLGGAPAPPAILAAFGITQGQQTAFTNRYNVYRTGNSTALAIFLYGNNPYTVPTYAYFDIDNLATTAVNEPGNGAYSTLLFPNPGTGNEINIKIMGEVPALHWYSIVDMQGRTVQSGQADLQNGDLRIQLNPQLPNGHYVITGTGPQKQTVLTEQFMLAR